MSAPVVHSSFASYCAYEVKTHRCLFALYLAAVSALIVVLVALQLEGSTNAIVGGSVGGLHLIGLAIAVWKYHHRPTQVVNKTVEKSAPIIDLDQTMKDLIAQANSILELTEKSIDMSRQSEESRALIEARVREAIYKCKIGTRDAYLVPIEDIASSSAENKLYALISLDGNQFDVDLIGLDGAHYPVDDTLQTLDGLKRIFQVSQSIYRVSFETPPADNGIDQVINNMIMTHPQHNMRHVQLEMCIDTVTYVNKNFSEVHTREAFYKCKYQHENVYLIPVKKRNETWPANDYLILTVDLKDCKIFKPTTAERITPLAADDRGAWVEKIFKKTHDALYAIDLPIYSQ